MSLMDKAAWAECESENVAALAPFSLHRTIREYVEKFWTAPKRR